MTDSFSGIPWSPPEYRLWIDEASTVLVRVWKDGTMEVATRERPDHTWGRPVYLKEEK